MTSTTPGAYSSTMAGQAGEGDPVPPVSRRRFVRGAVRAGAVAGVTAWVAPQLSSVALAQTAGGSEPPPTVNPTVVTRAPDPGVVTQPGGAARPGGAGGGTLPVTGAETQKLAAAGGAAVVAGEALLALSRRRRQPRPAIPADPGGTTGE